MCRCSCCFNNFGVIRVHLDDIGVHWGIKRSFLLINVNETHVCSKSEPLDSLSIFEVDCSFIKVYKNSLRQKLITGWQCYMYKTLFTKERGNHINDKMISNRMNYSSFLYINEKFKLCCCNSIKRLNHKCCCNIIFSIAVNSFFSISLAIIPNMMCCI